MTQDLATMQKHLNLAREHARELKIEKRALLVEQFETEQRLIKTKRKYQIGIAVLMVITLYIGYTNMRYAADVRWSADKIAENQDLQQRFDNVLNMLQIVNKQALELQNANEQLIKHCRPCDVNRAIKATPLPPLVQS